MTVRVGLLPAALGAGPGELRRLLALAGGAAAVEAVARVKALLGAAV